MTSQANFPTPPDIELDAPVVFQGQFGEYTIDDHDRREVLTYRTSLIVAAFSFAIATLLVLRYGDNPLVINALTPLYAIFCLALGVSLLTIHIYLILLHRTLQVFWGIGVVAAIALAFIYPEPLALTIYEQRWAIAGIGFTFAALTGIYFKEAFCFNRIETRFLTPIVPVLLLGHLFNFLPTIWEQFMLSVWATLFCILALRKTIQPIASDIGDKSVFLYLKKQKQSQA